jgi:hypothetical protein
VGNRKNRSTGLADFCSGIKTDSELSPWHLIVRRGRSRPRASLGRNAQGSWHRQRSNLDIVVAKIWMKVHGPRSEGSGPNPHGKGLELHQLGRRSGHARRHHLLPGSSRTRVRERARACLRALAGSRDIVRGSGRRSLGNGGSNCAPGCPVTEGLDGGFFQPTCSVQPADPNK